MSSPSRRETGPTRRAAASASCGACVEARLRPAFAASTVGDSSKKSNSMSVWGSGFSRSNMTAKWGPRKRRSLAPCPEIAGVSSRNAKEPEPWSMPSLSTTIISSSGGSDPCGRSAAEVRARSGSSGTRRSARDVALKVVPREGKAGSRAEREVEAAARLRHPRCLRALALERDDHHVYVAYEYVAGKTLRQCLRSGELDDAASVEVGAQVLDALAHAHGEEDRPPGREARKRHGRGPRRALRAPARLRARPARGGRDADGRRRRPGHARLHRPRAPRRPRRRTVRPMSGRSASSSGSRSPAGTRSRRSRRSRPRGASRRARRRWPRCALISRAL